MYEISTLRLYLLRGLYLLVVIGLGIVAGPGLVHHARWEVMDGVVQCMLAAFWFLCLLGLRYPLLMLPVLLWELIWKSLWLGLVAYPQWAAGQLEGAAANVASMCVMVVIFPFFIPWDYVYARYVKGRGDRWR